MSNIRRTLQAEDLLKLKLPEEPALHPDGERVAYVLRTMNPEENEYDTRIYLAAPGMEPVPYTSGPKDSHPVFSPDGRYLAFLSRRSGQPQVWILPTDGGEAWQLTRVQGGVAGFVWSPDSRRLAFLAMLDGKGLQPERKDDEETDLFTKHTKGVKVITELFHKLDGQGFLGERRPQVCLIEVAPEVEPRQLTAPPYSHGGLAFSPDGQHLLFTARRGPDYDQKMGSQQLWILPVAGGEPRQLTPAGFGVANPAWSPDGRWIAFTATRDEELFYDNDQLYLIPAPESLAAVPDQPLQPRPLAAGLDRPFSNRVAADVMGAGVLPPVWSPDSRFIYASVSDQGSLRLVRVAVDSGSVEWLTPSGRVAYGAAIDPRGRRAAVTAADPLTPGDLYLVDLSEGWEERLTRVNQELLEQLELSVPRRYTARSTDGHEVEAWVMPPVGMAEGRRYPTVLEIHGGPMAMYGYTFFIEFQLLAAHGYGVVYSNPRGSQGYGHAHCSSIRERWGDRDYADIMAALDQALAEHPWIDPDRLGVAGGSYGGYMTNWIVGHTDRFKAAITMRSVVDWKSMVGSGDGGWEWIRRAGGVWPWQDETWYREQSPITYVENIVTPLLIEHQEGDLRCPIGQGEMLYTAVKALGKAPVKFVRYPNEFHGMSRNGKPWHRVHRLKIIVDWFDQWLGAGREAKPEANPAVE